MNQSSASSLENPYQPMVSQSTTAVDAKVRSVNTWASIGMLAFGMVPAVLGTYGIIREQLHAASLPPGTPHCGMGGLAVLMILVVGTPLFAFAGSIVGWLAAKLWPS